MDYTVILEGSWSPVRLLQRVPLVRCSKRLGYMLLYPALLVFSHLTSLIMMQLALFGFITRLLICLRTLKCKMNGVFRHLRRRMMQTAQRGTHLELANVTMGVLHHWRAQVFSSMALIVLQRLLRPHGQLEASAPLVELTLRAP